MKQGIILFILLCCLPLLSGYAFAESEIESRIRTLEETLKKQEETIKAQQIMINELKEQIKKDEVAIIPETKETPPEIKKETKATGLFGGSALSNPNISMVFNTYAYSSNLTTDEIRNRGIAGYTTDGIRQKKRL